METRIEKLCNRPIILPRDFNAEPITPQELLDCLLLTAALDREYAEQMKRAVQTIMVCAPEVADLCKRTIFDLRHLPSVMLTDYVDLDDRMPEMAAACQTLRAMAVANPNQAEWLNAAADLLVKSWNPLEYEE